MLFKGNGDFATNLMLLPAASSTSNAATEIFQIAAITNGLLIETAVEFLIL